MQVIIHYSYPHASRPGDDCVPTYLTGQVDAHHHILVYSTSRTTDPYRPGEVVAIDDIIQTHALATAWMRQPIKMSIYSENPFSLDGLDAELTGFVEVAYL